MTRSIHPTKTHRIISIFCITAGLIFISPAAISLLYLMFKMTQTVVFACVQFGLLLLEGA